MIQNFKRLALAMLVVSVVLVQFSCKGDKKEDKEIAKVETQYADSVELEEEVFDVSDFDIMYLADGKFNFYRLSDSASAVYEGETDEIMNYCFKPESLLLYYSINDNGKVILKSVDFGEVNPEPATVIDFGLKTDDCESQTYGGYGSLMISKDGSAVGIQHNFSWDSYGFNMVKIYYPKTGKLKDGFNWDLFFDGNANIDYQAFDDRSDGLESDGYMYYYVKNGADVCLSDKIDFKSMGSFEKNPEEFSTYNCSPDGKYVLYGAILDWGDYPHGPYCIASLDGKYQLALEDTDIPDIAAIEWLANSSLIYVGCEPRPESDPDYDAEYNKVRSCIKIVPKGGKPEVLIHDANDFLVMNTKR